MPFRNNIKKTKQFISATRTARHLITIQWCRQRLWARASPIRGLRTCLSLCSLLYSLLFASASAPKGCCDMIRNLHDTSPPQPSAPLQLSRSLSQIFRRFHDDCYLIFSSTQNHPPVLYSSAFTFKCASIYAEEEALASLLCLFDRFT